MTAFVLMAALMLMVALLFVMPTLLRKTDQGQTRSLSDEVNLAILRDQFQELERDLAAGVIDQPAYASAKLELQRRVITDVAPISATQVNSPAKWGFSVFLAVLLSVISVSLYWYLGTPRGLEAGLAQAEQNQDQNKAVTPEQIAKMVAGLEQRLKSSPEDVNGWDMLARSYYFLGKYTDAARAYEQLAKRVPDNADVLADYADALGMSQNKSLQGEPEKIIAKALSLNPNSIKALALAASAAFEQHNYKAAIFQWQKILAVVEPDSDVARSVYSNINEAQTLLVGTNQETKPIAEEPSTNKQIKFASGPAVLEGQIELGANAKGKVNPEDTVFIFARAIDGPRFPLAVLRKTVKDLPVSFHLDDSMGMTPNAKLSDFQTVVVGARISRSGSATRSAGDWEGLSQPVHVGETQLKIIINSPID